MTMTTVPMFTDPPETWLRDVNAGIVRCPTCARRVGGEVVTGMAVFHDDEQTWAVRRRLFCPRCDHIVMWLESSTASGRPTGLMLTSCGFIRSKLAICKFLAAHPEAQSLETTR